MPAALTSTSFKLGTFTAVSSAFGAGLAAIALTYTAPEDPFGGAPVFEVELFRDTGMSAPVAVKGSSGQSDPPVQKVLQVSPPETPTPSQPTPAPQDTPRPVHISQTAPALTDSPTVAGSAVTQEAASSRASAPASTAGSAITGDNRRGAPNQGAQGSQQVDTYEAQVIRWLDARKRHPGRLEGVVTIKFEVDRRGRVRNCVVSKSSGDGRLDRIAQQQLREAAPLPRPPHDATWQTREMTVSLDYRRHA